MGLIEGNTWSLDHNSYRAVFQLLEDDVYQEWTGKWKSNGHLLWLTKEQIRFKVYLLALGNERKHETETTFSLG